MQHAESRYNAAAAVAAHIVNVLDGGSPPADRYARILALVLALLHDAEGRVRDLHAAPGEN